MAELAAVRNEDRIAPVEKRLNLPAQGDRMDRTFGLRLNGAPFRRPVAQRGVHLLQPLALSNRNTIQRSNVDNTAARSEGFAELQSEIDTLAEEQHEVGPRKDLGKVAEARVVHPARALHADDRNAGLFLELARALPHYGRARND